MTTSRTKNRLGGQTLLHSLYHEAAIQSECFLNILIIPVLLGLCDWLHRDTSQPAHMANLTVSTLPSANSHSSSLTGVSDAAL